MWLSIYILAKGGVWLTQAKITVGLAIEPTVRLAYVPELPRRDITTEASKDTATVVILTEELHPLGNTQLILLVKNS